MSSRGLPLAKVCEPGPKPDVVTRTPLFAPAVLHGAVEVPYGGGRDRVPVALHLDDDLAAPDRRRVQRVDVHAAVVGALGGDRLHAHGAEEVGDQVLEGHRAHREQVGVLVAAVGDDPVADVLRPPCGPYGRELVGAGRDLSAQGVGEAALRVHLRQVQLLERGALGHDGGEVDVPGAAGRRVVAVDEAVQRHRLQGALLVRGEQLVQHEQHALGQDLLVQRTPLAHGAGRLLVLVDARHVPDRLGLRHHVVRGQFPVQDELSRRRVVGRGHLAREALRPGRRGVQGGGEVLDHGVGLAAAHALDSRGDTGVVAGAPRRAGRPPTPGTASGRR